MPQTHTLTIGELAAEAGMSPDALRYYERRGLDLDALLPTLLPEGYRPHSISEKGPAPIDALSAIESAADVLLIPAERAAAA